MRSSTAGEVLLPQGQQQIANRPVSYQPRKAGDLGESGPGGAGKSARAKPELRAISHFNAFASFFVKDKKSKDVLLEEKREAVAYKVLLRLVIKIKRWRKQRAKAGHDALQYHFKGVAWSAMSPVDRATEIMAAACDGMVRMEASRAGVVLPGPSDVEALMRMTSAMDSESKGAADKPPGLDAVQLGPFLKLSETNPDDVEFIR